MERDNDRELIRLNENEQRDRRDRREHWTTRIWSMVVLIVAVCFIAGAVYLIDENIDTPDADAIQSGTVIDCTVQ